MDTKVLKTFGIFVGLFIILIVGLVIHDNMTKIVILKEDHISDVTFLDNKKNIYIFWGNGCSHCEELKEYLLSIKNKWQNDYQIFSFETWKDKENQNLMNDVLEILGKKNEGTPTVIIGDKVLVGYGTDMNSEYEEAFNSQKNNEYDVIKKYQEQ